MQRLPARVAVLAGDRPPTSGAVDGRELHLAAEREQRHLPGARQLAVDAELRRRARTAFLAARRATEAAKRKADEEAPASAAKWRKLSDSDAYNTVMDLILDLFLDADEPETIELSALQSAPAVRADIDPVASTRLAATLERLENDNLIMVREGKIWRV